MSTSTTLAMLIAGGAVAAVLMPPWLAAAGEQAQTSGSTRLEAAASSYVRLADGARSGDPQGAGIEVAAGPGHGVPANIVVPIGLQGLLRRMWQRSPTFRRQCARIASVGEVNVRIRWRSSTGDAACAKTTVRPHAKGLEADVRLGCPERIVELLAHEIEHIIEQLEGVRLADMARRVPSLVRAMADGSFETRRAIDVGRAVAAEVEGG
jgi:hypothetical protein